MSDGLRMAKLSESGLAIGTSSSSEENSFASGLAINPKVTASENPLAVIIFRSCRVWLILGSDGGVGVSRAGNVAGKRSKP